jgi:hypothetical protein
VARHGKGPPESGPRLDQYSFGNRPPTLPAEPGARGFQKGHQKLGGRRKGSRNRFGGDLREAVVAGIQATGFIEKDKKGRPVATGRGGCIGTIDAWT